MLQQVENDQFGCKILFLITMHCKYSEEIENCIEKKFIFETHQGGYVSRTYFE